MENKKRYNPNVETNLTPFIGEKDPLKYLELTLSCRIPIRLEDGVDMDEVIVFDEDGKGNGKVTPKMYNLLSEKSKMVCIGFVVSFVVLVKQTPIRRRVIYT